MMRPFQEEVALLSEITGLKKTIEAIIAEVGVDMSRFEAVCPRVLRRSTHSGLWS